MTPRLIEAHCNPMSPEIRYPNLKYLMDYFHQDWKHDFKFDADLLLNAFASENAASVVTATIKEARLMLEDISDPKKIDNILTERWRSETPYAYASESICWLKHAVGQLEEGLTKRVAPPPETAAQRRWKNSKHK